LPLLLALLCLLAFPGRAEEFTGEAYRIGTSVVSNGSSGAVPSRFHTATQYLDFPGDFGPARLFRLEMATLPAFADLSQNVNGALAYSLDDKTRINLFGGMITNGDVIERKSASLERMISALDEANEMIQELSPEELAEITKQVSEPWLATPVEVVADQWRLAKGYVHDGEVTPEQWQASLEGYQEHFESAAIDPTSPAQAYDAAVDMGPLTAARAAD